MLKVRKLSLTIKGREILNIDNFHIQSPGLYFILGPSGCGKTTFLNVIAGLNTTFKGYVRLFNNDYLKMGEKQITKFRAKHISVFFQHNIFIEDLTLEENISLTGVNSKETRSFTSQKIDKIARNLNIEPILKQKVKTLSGGEKTRGSLARTLIKESPLYLFDEPTAALDPLNARNVMFLIKEKAEQSVVIVVTHDDALAREYGHKIFMMDEGRIGDIESMNNSSNTSSLMIARTPNYQKNSDYITKRLMKAKRIRNGITGFSVNLGLVGLGLSFLLINSVNNKLINTFKGQYESESAFITPKVNPKVKTIKSLANAEIKSLIKGDYKVGSFYLNNINELFPSRNRLILKEGKSIISLPSFHAALFNESLFLEEVDDELYPYVDVLMHDEIGLVLPYDDFKVLQNILGLPFKNAPDDLGTYLAENDVILTLEVANNYWDYDDEHSFTLKTVRLGYEAQVIFGDPSYVSELFEEKMMLPSSLSLTKVEEYPWTLKKMNYLFIIDPESILWDKQNHANTLLFSAKNGYFNYIFDNRKLLNRIFVLEKPPHFSEILELDLTPLFYTFNGGLTFIEELMLLGFTNNFFISSDKDLLDDIIKNDTDNFENTKTEFNYPPGIINLALQFNGLNSFQYIGDKYTYKLNEIGLSKALAKTLFKGQDVSGNYIHIGALTNIRQSGDALLKEYETLTLKIIDVFDDDKFSIYHHPLWAYLLFTHQFGVFPLHYALNGAVTNTNVVIENENFNVSYPFASFKETINNTLDDLEKYTFFTAAGAFILAGFIVFMVIYLLVFETSEQFSSLYLMGYSKDIIHNIVILYILRFIGSIVLLSLIQLFLFSFIIEFALAEFLKTSFTYSFSLKPYVIVLLFSLILLVLLLTFFKQRMQKNDLLQFSKRDL